MELKARQFASTKPEPHITFLPDEAGVRRNPGVGVGGVDCWFVQTADGREIVIRSEQEARKRWSEERQKLLDMWRAEYAARKQFDAVVSRIRTKLYDGNLHAVALLQRDGRWVNIPVHVWARSDISAIFELGDSDTNWRNPNVISFSTEIEGYGTRNVKGTTLISEGELQVLLGERAEHSSEHETEPDGREWPTPLKVTPKEKPEDGEENKAAGPPKAVPGMTKKSSQKRRRGGPKPAPYYSKLVKLMALLHEKEFAKFENGTTAELRDLVKWRFKNDSVKGYPESRSGLDNAIAKAKREVIDSADRL